MRLLDHAGLPGRLRRDADVVGRGAHDACRQRERRVTRGRRHDVRRTGLDPEARPGEAADRAADRVGRLGHAGDRDIRHVCGRRADAVRDRADLRRRLRLDGDRVRRAARHQRRERESRVTGEREVVGTVVLQDDRSREPAHRTADAVHRGAVPAAATATGAECQRHGDQRQATGAAPAVHSVAHRRALLHPVGRFPPWATSARAPRSLSSTPAPLSIGVAGTWIGSTRPARHVAGLACGTVTVSTLDGPRTHDP